MGDSVEVGTPVFVRIVGAGQLAAGTIGMALFHNVWFVAVALVIVHFVESMSGIRAVQAFRREPRNEEIFEVAPQGVDRAADRGGFENGVILGRGD